MIPAGALLLFVDQACLVHVADNNLISIDAAACNSMKWKTRHKPVALALFCASAKFLTAWCIFIQSSFKHLVCAKQALHFPMRAERQRRDLIYMAADDETSIMRYSVPDGVP